MPSELRIAPMASTDLRHAVDWAADEGWNPGLDDAEAFRAVDPAGFLMGWLGDQPVAAISVVRHNDAFGFLGLYLCRSGFRGRGYGWALWQAGLAYLGDRTIGLDGVVAQQDNYRKSGFAYAHNTRRWEGPVVACAHPAFTAPGGQDMADMLVLDQSVQGLARTAYMTAWLTEMPTRRTLIRRGPDGIDAMGTIRACRSGHKIGPLIAPDPDSAQALMESLAAVAGAQQIALDVPDSNGPAVSLAQSLGLSASFACARMYRGPAPSRDLSRIFGETTFELG